MPSVRECEWASRRERERVSLCQLCPAPPDSEGLPPTTHHSPTSSPPPLFSFTFSFYLCFVSHFRCACCATLTHASGPLAWLSASVVSLYPA